MSAAMALAARGLGATWPNPSVGCIIVAANGQVVGRGRTGTGGRPHAEAQALAMAGAGSRGGTAYVTLEPCSHHGQTPPCADALIAAGVSRAVVAEADPDARVNGAGLARLRAAGIEVVSGFMAVEARETLAGFFARVRLGRPLVTLKLASTLDGRIATRTGESQWITGGAARAAAHALRGRHDAVMVGAGTVLADDPDLTCRLPGYPHRPTVRLVADGFLRTKLAARLVATSRQDPSWLIYHTDGVPGAPTGSADTPYRPPTLSPAHLLTAAGAQCIQVTRAEHGIDLVEAFSALGTRGLTRVLVEGGAKLASSLLRADLVDRIVWFHAPGVMGGDGLPAVQGFGLAELAKMRRFIPLRRPAQLGADVMTEFCRAE